MRGSTATPARTVTGCNPFTPSHLRPIAPTRDNANYPRFTGFDRDQEPDPMLVVTTPTVADRVVGTDLDYESLQIGQGVNMLVVSANGTAVRLR
jgi:hypothetical protein